MRVSDFYRFGLLIFKWEFRCRWSGRRRDRTAESKGCAGDPRARLAVNRALFGLDRIVASYRARADVVGVLIRLAENHAGRQIDRRTIVDVQHVGVTV